MKRTKFFCATLFTVFALLALFSCSNPANTGTPGSLAKSRGAKIVNVTYDANGTEATMPEASVISYTLNGWYTTADGDSLIINNSTTPSFSSETVSGYISDGKWAGTEDKTLYAQWTSEYITLPYLTYNSYRCTWNTKTDGTGDDYSMGQHNFSTNKDLTLYANCSHVCCNSAITNSSNCKNYGGSNACYHYKGSHINEYSADYNFCETPTSTCSSTSGWHECGLTFTTCHEDTPTSCYGSCYFNYCFNHCFKCRVCKQS